MAQLTVHVPELADARSALVEVRDESMRIVSRPRCGDPLDIDPGLYLASVTLPSGGEYRQTVEIQPAQQAEVVLGPSPPATAGDTAGKGDGFALESAVVTADLAGSAADVQAPAQESALGHRSCWVRLISGKRGKPLEQLGASLRPVDSSERGSGPGLELEYTAAPTDSVVFAQVATDDGTIRNVALPAAPASAIACCRLHIVLGPRGISLTALPAARTSTTLIASYLVTGNLRTAANVAKQAEQALARERDDPVGAALGAYALLRLGQGGRLPDEPTALRRAFSLITRRGGLPQADQWLGDLARRCKWLPDGAIVAGELARRNGRDNEAETLFAIALRRGLPMFSDGLSLLVSELRTNTPGLLRSHGRAKRLLATSSFADYSQLAVVLPGVDPTRADDCRQPSSPFPTSAGWRAFDCPGLSAC